MTQEDIGVRLLRGQKRQTKLIVLCFVVIALLCGYVLRMEQQTRKALCTFRTELVVTNQQSRDFIKKHPKGIPGIPAVSIQVGIDNRQRTIDSLDSLHCG